MNTRPIHGDRFGRIFQHTPAIARYAVTVMIARLRGFLLMGKREWFFCPRERPI